MNVRGGGSLHSFGFTTDQQLENLEKVQNYAKKRSGVPIEEPQKAGVSKKRSILSLLLLVLALAALFVFLYLFTS